MEPITVFFNLENWRQEVHLAASNTIIDLINTADPSRIVIQSNIRVFLNALELKDLGRTFEDYNIQHGHEITAYRMHVGPAPGTPGPRGTPGRLPSTRTEDGIMAAMDALNVEHAAMQIDGE